MLWGQPHNIYLAAIDSYALVLECTINLQILIKEVSQWFVNRNESATYAYHNVFLIINAELRLTYI